MSMVRITWSDEEIRLATEMWNDGKSAKSISKTFKGKFSRSSVAGKLSRLGLRRSDKPAPLRKKRAEKKTDPVVLDKEKKNKEASFNPTHQRASFNFLRKGSLYVHASGVGYTDIEAYAWRGTKSQGQSLVEQSKEYKAEELRFEFICHKRPRKKLSDYNRD